MPIESMIPSNHLILCCPFLLLSLSQHQGLLQWVSSLYQVAKDLELQLQHPSKKYSGLISFRIDWFDLLPVQGTLKILLQHHSSKPPILWCSASFMVQISHPYMATGKTIDFTIWTFIGKWLPCFLIHCLVLLIFPGGSDGKESVCNARDLGSIPGSGRCPGEGNGNPLQYSYLENPMERGV